MGLSIDEFNALSESAQEKVILRTEQTFLQNGADFTIRSMSELPPLIERINRLISEGKRPYVKMM